MIENPDERLKLLIVWLQTALETDKFTLQVASSDASFRRYFRAKHADQSWIVMDAPPAHEDIQPFISIADFLEQQDVDVPKIFARNIEEGFLLLTDFGDSPFLSVVTHNNADTLYKQAIDEIIRMQLSLMSDITLPKYNAALLHRELDLFPEWFLKRHLGLNAPDELQHVFNFLVDEAQQQPQYFVHRDYHSRNLMIPAPNKIGIIDFQDAVVGPVTYDLVSLLRDCYIAWPQEKINSWLNYYYEQALSQHLLSSDITLMQLHRWFDLMGLQRHLKVLGIFCRLNYRDNKTNYMNDLPLTLKYTLNIAEKYAELAPLHAYLVNSKEIMAIL